MTIEEYLSIYQGVTIKRLMTSLALNEKEVMDELSQIGYKIENGLVYLTEPSKPSKQDEPTYLTPKEIWLAIFDEREMQTWNGSEWVLYRKSNPKSIKAETGKVRYSLPLRKKDKADVITDFHTALDALKYAQSHQNKLISKLSPIHDTIGWFAKAKPKPSAKSSMGSCQGRSKTTAVETVIHGQARPRSPCESWAVIIQGAKNGKSTE